MDGRTTCRPGYEISQRFRKHIAEVFGWAKGSAGLAKVKLRGQAKVDAVFTLTLPDKKGSDFRAGALPGRKTGSHFFGICSGDCIVSLVSRTSPLSFALSAPPDQSGSTPLGTFWV